jgi:MFS family permease
LFGRLSDRWGPGRVQRLTGLLIPVVPALWALSRSPWHLVPTEMASGFLWAGYSLASFNFLLTLIPQDRRARYAALYQIVVTGALALGAALGGGLATWQGYRLTFAFSGLGRLVAALLFVRVIRGAATRPVQEPIPADSIT